MLSALSEKEKGTKPFMSEIPKKRPRIEETLDGNTELELNYPFLKQESRDTDGSDTISVDASGPLRLNSGVLSLSTEAPIATNSRRSLALQYDTSAFEVSDGKLQLKSDSPIVIGRNGIALNTDSTLGINGTSLGLRLAEPSGLSSSNGLSVKTGTGLKLEDGGIAIDVASNSGLGTDGGLHVNAGSAILVNDNSVSVQCSPQGAVVNDGSGLAVNVDSNTISISENAIGVKTVSGNGLTVSDGGIGVAVNQDSMQLNESGIGLKLMENSGLKANAGVGINTDGTSVVLNDGAVSVNVSKTKPGLVLENDGVGISLADGGALTATAEGVAVMLSDGGGIENDGGLKIKLDPTGPIIVRAGQLQLNTDETLTLVNGALSVSNPSSGGSEEVQIDPNGGLTSSTSGIAINAKADGGIGVSSEGVAVKTKTGGSLQVGSDGMSVMLNTNGGITDSGSGIGLNLSASSGLSLSSNALSIRLKSASGMVCDSNGLSLLVGSQAGLELTDESYVRVKASSSGGIDRTTNGLVIKLPSRCGLRTSDSGLTVNLADNSGLQISDANGLSVKLKSTGAILSTATDGMYVNLATNSGLQISSNNGLSVKLKGAGGLQSSATDGMSVKLKSGGGLAVDSSGLYVTGSTLSESRSIDSTLGVDGKTIGVKDDALYVRTKEGGILESDENGLFVLYNTSDFVNHVQNGLSTVTPIRHLSPYCAYETGNLSLDEFTTTGISSTGAVWSLAHSAIYSNSNGIVTCLLNVKVSKKTIQNLGNAPSDGNDRAQFTIILNPSGRNEGQHSNITAGTSFPTDYDCKPYMTPLPETAFSAEVCNYTQSWYNGGNSTKCGTVVQFVPDGDLYNYQTSTMNYYVGCVSGTSPKLPVIVVTYDIRLSGGNWYNLTNGTFCTGYQTLSWRSSIPSFVQSFEYE